MDITDQAVAEALDAVIAQSPQSQKAVARAVGISETTLSRLVNGRRPLKVAVLMRLAQVLGIPAGRVLDDAAEKLS